MTLIAGTYFPTNREEPPSLTLKGIFTPTVRASLTA
jgi:hypothetical protein